MEIFQVLTQEDFLQTEEEKERECSFYWTFAETFSDCCEAPYFNFPDDLWERCMEECSEHRFTDDCCYQKCYLSGLGIVKLVANGNDTAVSDFDWDGVGNLYMITVGNDPQWEPVVKKVVTRCVNQFVDDNYDCNFLTKVYPDIVDCISMQNYLQCPGWNPQGLSNCTFNYLLVSKCGFDGW